MENQNSNSDTTQGNNQNSLWTNNSLLDQIIASSKNATAETLNNNATPVVNTQTAIGNISTEGNANIPQQKNPRDPMSTATILKMLATIFLLCLIFLGMFLAYIVFNPQEAGFFQTVFNVSRNNVANTLANLINGSFGILSFLVSIVFVFTGFKAFWTPKEQKRKRIVMGLGATFSGIIFFSILIFWAFLFNKLQAANFLNPDGNILVYDNSLYIHEETRKYSDIFNTNSLIGPITLRYDISDNARSVARKNGIILDGYEIDFDDAKCSSGNDIMKGVNPVTATEIICTFDTLKNYNPIGHYTITDYQGVSSTIPIKFSPVQIQWLVKIEDIENQAWKKLRTYDASSLRHLWQPIWIHMDDNKKLIKEAFLPVELTDTKKITYFYLDNQEKNPTHSRYFITQNEVSQNDNGVITMTQNITNPQEYIFRVENLTESPDEILSIKWELNDSLTVCENERGNACAYTFNSYGVINMKATINILGNKQKKIINTFHIDEPLSLSRNIKVGDTNGKNLNPKSTYDLKTRMFVIKDIRPPQKIFLDARDVITTNGWYSLKDVNWRISDGKTIETRRGDKIEFDVKRAARYHIVAEYTFEKNIKTGRDNDVRKTNETVLLDLEKENLSANLKVHSTSDYVPSKITVDASESYTEYWEIVKFIYDFGEGRPAAEGDAIQTYQYTTPGEKIITVTIVDANGQKASTKHTLVLKDTPKNLNFTTSLSPGIIDMPVDFVASGTTGKIEDYLWNFGDNTPISHGYEVSHIFKKTGVYNVTLTVRYEDGTEKNISQPFKVEASLE